MFRDLCRSQCHPILMCGIALVGNGQLVHVVCCCCCLLLHVVARCCSFHLSLLVVVCSCVVVSVIFAHSRALLVGLGVICKYERDGSDDEVLCLLVVLCYLLFCSFAVVWCLLDVVVSLFFVCGSF